MRLTLIAVGKLRAGPDRDLFNRYWGRLETSARAAGLTAVTHTDLPESRAATAAERKADEAKRTMKAAGSEGFMIALDETGTSLTSAGFAQHMRRLADSGTPALSILIGGPDGHDQTIHARASLLLNLGTLTLPHGLARIVIAEQLYRATTILSGHPYHRV